MPQDVRPPYRWCSALRSSRGCIRTCRPGRSRVRHSVGGRPVGRMRPPSNHPHSGRCLLRRRHGHHSQRHRSLWARKKGPRGGGRRRENKSLLSQLLLGTRVTLGHLVRLCEQEGFQRLGRVLSPANDPEEQSFGRGLPALASSPGEGDCAAPLCLLFPTASLSLLLCLPLPKGTCLLNRCEKKSDLIKSQLCVKTKRG